MVAENEKKKTDFKQGKMLGVSIYVFNCISW